MRPSRGAYAADRAAALSGVPVSSVHRWAHENVLVPSASLQRPKLWSYTDLMGLRIVHWLIQAGTAANGAMVPRATMPSVREALRQLQELDFGLCTRDRGAAVTVDRRGRIQLVAEPDLQVSVGESLMATDDELLTVTDAFVTAAGGRGPDLNRPRPGLRIAAGRLGGSPHVAHTRVESQALASLVLAGLPKATVYALYPSVSREAINEALDLERQLQSTG